MPHLLRPAKRIVLALCCLCFVFSASSQSQKGVSAMEIPGDSLETLIRVLEVSDILELLDNRGDFTVFAPSNAAFERMGQGTVQALLQPENKPNLKSLLSYHIVPGKLTASWILRALCRGKGSASFTTIQGEELLATMDGTDIVLTDCSGNQARITSADSSSRNLVFHRIDKVVTPLPQGSIETPSADFSAGSR